MNKKHIYFHVGTGKTGTKFIQYQVFPKFKGIYYIQRTKYRRVKKIITDTHHKKYLVSNEFDQQLEKEVKLFAASFPQTIPIMVFRQHDSYITSQYRRFVKNGFTGGFHEFFDLENDTGYFKKKDLDYTSQIQILEKYFNSKPIVLIYEDLIDDPIEFIKTLTRILDVDINLQKLNLNRKHTSYSAQQLKAIKYLGKYINLNKRRIFKNNLLHLLWRLYLGAIRYGTLYFAKLIPKRYFDDSPLIPVADAKKIKDYYKKDWESCLVYANKMKDEMISH
jgi:hypothetical protein